MESYFDGTIISNLNIFNENEGTNVFQLIFKIIIFIILIYLSHKQEGNKIPFTDKISVIIPTYNRGNSLIKSLNSVLLQTYHNLEVFVIDDCSTDDTEYLISNLKDDRIKYIKLKENKGANFARNIGIQMSTGKYISFQDSDDIYHKDKIERQYKNLIKKKSDLDFCEVSLNFNNSFKSTIPNQIQQKKIRRKKILDELCNGNFISTQAILVKNSFIKENLFDINFPRFQDYDFILRIIPKCKVSYSKKVLVDLYRTKDSIGNNLTKLNQSFHLLSLKKYNINCKNDSFLASPFKFYTNYI